MTAQEANKVIELHNEAMDLSMSADGRLSKRGLRWQALELEIEAVAILLEHYDLLKEGSFDISIIRSASALAMQVALYQLSAWFASWAIPKANEYELDCIEGILNMFPDNDLRLACESFREIRDCFDLN